MSVNTHYGKLVNHKNPEFGYTESFSGFHVCVPAIEIPNPINKDWTLNRINYLFYFMREFLSLLLTVSQTRYLSKPKILLLIQ